MAPRRRAGRIGFAWLPALVAVAVLTWSSPGTARAQDGEYTLETVATYDVQPDERRIAVTVEIRFTNTTPDPPGQFSAFNELQLAVHDQATEVAASDASGDLSVSVAVQDDVNVATVELREQLRHEQTAELQLRYVLPDTDTAALRVRSSAVVFQAWSFGTSGEVRVAIPAEYQVHVDGDSLTDESGVLVSGPIADPTQWLALVTALADPEYAIFESTVALTGGTADLQVRAFADDEAWGRRVVAMLERALPIMEEEVGLPYPGMGDLVVTQAVALDRTGIGEGRAEGGEILVAFDQPDFTILHQVAHLWLSESLIEARWIREGMASEVAERVAAVLEVPLPYEPAAVAEEHAAVAFPLDQWSADAGRGGEAYGYARSWGVMRDLVARLGEDALRAVLLRTAQSVGAYAPVAVAPKPLTENNLQPPTAPLTTRSFLDHLENVTGVDVTDIFAAHVLAEADLALLEARGAARQGYAALAAASGEWGVPDPVAGAMVAWSFDDATSQIDAARAWLVERDALVEELEDSGLSAPDRLQQAYRAHGGGADAQAELDAEREVARSYADTTQAVAAERSVAQTIGLVGAPDPEQQLRLANGRFADGDLRGALDAIADAQQTLGAAEAAGFARLGSAALIAIVLLVIAAVLLRRRGAYTRPSP